MAIVRCRKPCRDSGARRVRGYKRRRRCTCYGAHAVRCASAAPPLVNVEVRAEAGWAAGCGEGQGQGRRGQRTPPPPEPGAPAQATGLVWYAER